MIHKVISALDRNSHAMYSPRIIHAWGNLAKKPALWRRGYGYLKSGFIRKVLSQNDIIQAFRRKARLPLGYGYGIDERCIEYPWFFVSASSKAEKYLDAGSTLNNKYLLTRPFWKGKKLTILTLAPEPTCSWDLGVSYQFADLRDMPFRDQWFDEIACLSTLEHVGMDNFLFTRARHHREQSSGDFKKALLEMRRILKPGGRLLLSVPFGRYQNWGIFQQFDKMLLDQAAAVFQPRQRRETWYRYSNKGWQIADCDACMDLDYSKFIVRTWTQSSHLPALEPDLATGARAVVCCVWQRN
jgi:SAM-dependent methyltransferase